jgi:hypothetical protein
MFEVRVPSEYQERRMMVLRAIMNEEFVEGSTTQ